MITADAFYTYYRPSECPRRVWLDANRPTLRAPVTEFEQIRFDLGRAHEQRHLAALGGYAQPDYPPGDLQAGAAATLGLAEARAPVIYQGVLLAPDGRLGGRPDFLIWENGAYVIRDTKLALSLEGHSEIPAQLNLYVLLARQTAGLEVARGEVAFGDGHLEPITFVDPTPLAEEIAALQAEPAEPDEAVGWSKCDTCGFFDHCWGRALALHDPAIVYGVSQAMRHALRQSGIRRYEDVLATPITTLAEVKVQSGGGQRRIGVKAAERIVRQAGVLQSGHLRIMDQPEAPAPGPIVYFDVESDPWEVGAATTVYLWGLLLDRGDGSEPEYWGEIAERGDAGDQAAWESFLTECQRLRAEHGHPPFIHYSSYEHTQMVAYLKRWGDTNGVAGEVRKLLWDMKREVIDGHLCLPIPSYGLKHTEKCAGFERSQEEYGSLWSVGRYHAYIRSRDPAERDQIRRQLLDYNREDCLAMKHVLEWARSLEA
jgi:predicted RecB family nuclease